MSDEIDPSFWRKPADQLTDEEYRAARKGSYEWGVAHGANEATRKMFELFGTSSPEKVAERLKTAEAIVRDLAGESWPIATRDGIPCCGLCVTALVTDGKEIVGQHHESCPWRRARELMGDQQDRTP